MSAIATETNELAALKARLQTTWTAGDYDRFSRYMERGAEEFCARLQLAPGTTLLDVGCGAGQLAIIAARAGVVVTGCDIAPNWIEAARARADFEGIPVAFETGDAEALPFADAQFDTVASLIGAMFAPRPHLVAAELTRVCRPGGTIAMANWTPQGFIGRMFRVISRHIAPPGMPSPVLWGDEATVRERFGTKVRDLRMTRRMYAFDYPFPPRRVVDFFRTNYGPMNRAFASLGAEAQQALHAELTALWSGDNAASDGGTEVHGEYLEVIATRC